MKKIFQSLASWHQDGLGVALAVVHKTWGSAPRRAGSLMAIAEDGRFAGSVSGGCVEGTVIAEAMALVPEGGSKLLHFTVASEDAWQVGLACGGEIEIQLIVLSGDVAGCASAIDHALNRRMKHTLSLELHNGTMKLDQGANGESHRLDADCLYLPIMPLRHLVIIGAVHIAQHLSAMAHEAGYDITVIDPRAAFIENREFGSAALVAEWPDEIFKASPPDTHTAVVALTHDPKIDDAALLPALKSDCFYIGALGSRKTQAARRARLEKSGVPEDRLQRIHGPIGLNIGAANPAEIAVAILAEITQVLRQQHAV